VDLVAIEYWRSELDKSWWARETFLNGTVGPDAQLSVARGTWRWSVSRELRRTNPKAVVRFRRLSTESDSG
jgi:hypothetical protein